MQIVALRTVPAICRIAATLSGRVALLTSQRANTAAKWKSDLVPLVTNPAFLEVYAQETAHICMTEERNAASLAKNAGRA